MKMQESAIFVKKIENKCLEDKKYCNYTRKYKGAAHRKWNLKYSVPKTFQQFFIMNQTMITALS